MSSVIKQHMNMSVYQSVSNRQFVPSDCFQSYGKYRETLKNRGLIERIHIEKVLSGHTGCVNSVLFSEHADYIYTGSDDTHVNIYRTEGGEMVDTITTIHTNNIFYARDLPFSERSLIVTCAADGRVALTNMETRGTRQLYRHRGRAHRIALVPDTLNQFYSCGEDGVCCLFDIRDRGRALFANTITNDEDNMTTPVAKTLFKGGRGRGSIYTIGVNPSRPWQIALAGEDSHVAFFDCRMFDSATSYLCPSEMAVNRAHVTGIKFSHNGHALIASYSAGDIFSFRVDEHMVNERRPIAAKHPVISSYASEAVTSSSASSAMITVDPRVELGYALRFSGHRNRDTVKQVSFLGNRSEWVLSGSDCGHIFVWDASTAEVVAVRKGDSRGAVNCFATHPNVPYFCSSGLDNEAKFWSPSGEPISLEEGSAARLAAQRVVQLNGEEQEDEEDDTFTPATLRRLFIELLREEAAATNGGPPLTARSVRMLQVLSELMPAAAETYRHRLLIAPGAELVGDDLSEDDDDEEMEWETVSESDSGASDSGDEGSGEEEDDTNGTGSDSGGYDDEFDEMMSAEEDSPVSDAKEE